MNNATGKGKVSLVVVRSWLDLDQAPKIKAIASQEEERSVKLEPDLKGHFLAEEIPDQEHDPRFTPRGRTFSTGSRSNKEGSPGVSVLNGSQQSLDQNGVSPEPPFLRKKHAHLDKSHVNRHSYCGFGENGQVNGNGSMERSFSNLHLPCKKSPPTTLEIRPGSTGTNSPDGQDGSSIEYTPPSSPVAGRYRNLGPELAATIPKRTIKSSWITGIKSRWMRNCTTHPDSGHCGTLKSYSSSPNLIHEHLAEAEGTPFYNPLYKLSLHRNLPQHFRNCSSGSGESTSGVVVSADDDSDHCRSRSSLSNNLSYSPSPTPSSHQRHSHESSLSPVASLRKQILFNSSRPNGLQKHNSVSDISEESLLFFGSFTGSPNYKELLYGGEAGTVVSRQLEESQSPLRSVSAFSPQPQDADVIDVDECVLVEIIRKSETANPVERTDKKPVSSTEGKQGAKNEDKKQHAVTDCEGAGAYDNCNNKFVGVKVEGSPGKVAKIKENVKRFGRFGRGRTERILKFKAESKEAGGESCDSANSSLKIHQAVLKEEPQEKTEIHLSDDGTEKRLVLNKESKEFCIKSHEEEGENGIPITIPIPTARKRSNNSNVDEASHLPPLNILTKSNEGDQREVLTSPSKSELRKEPETDTEDCALTNRGESCQHQNQNSVPFDIDPTNSIRIKQIIDDERSGGIGCYDVIEPSVPVVNGKVFTDKNVIYKGINIDSNSITQPRSVEDSTSLVSDQDRSMCSNVQFVPTIDADSVDETFVVHSGIDAIIANDDGSSPSSELSKEVECIIETATNYVPLKCMNEFNFKGPAKLPAEFYNCETEDDTELIIVDNINKANFIRKEENKEEMLKDKMNGSVKNFHSKHYSNEVMLHNDKNGSQSIVTKLANFTPDSQSISVISGGVIRHGKAASISSLGSTSATNGMASVQVPVQAINRHVGYATSSSLANSIEDYDQDQGSSGSSSTSESRSTDLEWHRSSTRACFRGFCQGLLGEEEKIILQVPSETVEASISFDNDEDNNSLEADENSQDYVQDYIISIPDVKVSYPQKSKGPESELKPLAQPLPNCVISVDIGSRGSGYSYWVKEEGDCVRIGNVDFGNLCPKSHKLPSWMSVNDLYVDANDDEDEPEIHQRCSPLFGYQALNNFIVAPSTQSHFYWKWREQFNEASSFPYTLESKSSDEHLQILLQHAIKHYVRIALDQIASKKIDHCLDHGILAVTIPASFDNRARQIIREAAFRTELVSNKDALALIEDPCAAGIYSYHAIKNKLSKMSSIGTSYLSVDVGGAFLHISGYEYQNGKLHQILSPKSQLISEIPEALFEAEMCGLFTPAFIFNYQNKYRGGWMKLMTEFDNCKNMYDPQYRGNYPVFVPSSFVDHFRRFTSMEVEDALESSDLSWSKVGAIGFPYWKLQRLLQPLLDFVKNYVTNILKSRRYEFLVLTGGRSGSRLLVDHLKHTLRDFSIDLVIPKEYSAAVLQGSTIALTNLAPRLFIKCPFSIGVGVMTPFIEDKHPEEKRVKRDGKSWCADVWDSLIKVGQEMEINQVVLKRSYVGAQPGQSLLILPLFQSGEEPQFVTESSVKKCCEFKFNSGQRAWQEVELAIKCRPSELLIVAIDDGVTKSTTVLDFCLN